MAGENVYIIGAGISGLIAALELERAGISPIILEASDCVGGRVKTDEKDGFLLDHGFQVLLTAYPEAQRYLDYEALNLKDFEPGAVVFGKKETFLIADPLRQPLKMFSMAFSPVGTILDKVKMFKLTQNLKRKSIEDIFEEPSISTQQYLINYGFTEQIINSFFKPFFAGIFLEKELKTSSRMFEFVFKMFSLGGAAVPSGGMGQIPQMLFNQLITTKVCLNSSVSQVIGQKIIMADGEELTADKIIIATQPDKLMDQLKGQFPEDNHVTTLYFSLQKSFMARPMLGLIPDENKLINNLVFMTDVSSAYSANDRALLSVSIIESSLTEKQLITEVQKELEEISGIKAQYFKFVKSYFITNAIPKVEDMKASMAVTECKIADHIFLAGDYLLNGSINASMTSGRTAAQAVIASLS